MFYGKKTALHYAAEKGRIRAVKDLVEKKGANVNAKDEYGYTALHEAVEENQMEVVKFLVANGADVNARNNEGITPLRDVAYEGHKEIAEFLVANGAKVNVADNKKVTPLHMAAYEGHEEIVKLLAANGADSNAADKDGDTPLHLATKNGHKWIAEFLVANGAEVNTKNKYGETPLDLARERGHTEVVELLVKYINQEENSKKPLGTANSSSMQQPEENKKPLDAAEKRVLSDEEFAYEETLRATMNIGNVELIKQCLKNYLALEPIIIGDDKRVGQFLNRYSETECLALLCVAIDRSSIVSRSIGLADCQSDFLEIPEIIIHHILECNPTMEKPDFLLKSFLPDKEYYSTYWDSCQKEMIRTQMNDTEVAQAGASKSM